jgi:hypothetical protein
MQIYTRPLKPDILKVISGRRLASIPLIYWRFGWMENQAAYHGIWNPFRQNEVQTKQTDLRISRISVHRRQRQGSC